MRLKSSQTTNRGGRGETAFCNVSDWVAFAVSVVGCLYLFGRENPSELKETVKWKSEIGRHACSTDAREHRADELDIVELRAWNMKQLDKTPLALPLARQISTHRSLARSF